MEDRFVLTLRMTDGGEQRFELLSVFEAENGSSFAALMPLGEDDAPEADASVQLVRAIPTHDDEGGDDYTFESISDDNEFEIALDAFGKLDFVQTDAPEAPADDSEEVSFPVISLMNPSGVYEDCQLVDIFKVGNRQYVAVMPIETPDGEPETRLFRATITKEAGIEGINVSTIPSDMEFEEAVRVFKSRLKDSGD